MLLGVKLVFLFVLISTLSYFRFVFPIFIFQDNILEFRIFILGFIFCLPRAIMGPTAHISVTGISDCYNFLTIIFQMCVSPKKFQDFFLEFRFFLFT